jgi:hypothetical protein
MITEAEIRKRLNAVIDFLVLPLDRDRAARYTIDRLVPEVAKLLKEQRLERKSKREE